MRLSEAIRIGSTFRGETHDGPFTRIANTEELRSDVWGAACEAVHSLIAKRNWTDESRGSDIEALREIQQKYFAEYFKSPATCPGAKKQVYSQAGGRFTGRVSQGLNEFAIEREKSNALPAITTACPAITNLAELIEHMFYVHNWSREECAQAVEDYETYGSMSQIERNFVHYSDEVVRQRRNEQLTVAARMRERQRHARRSYFVN